MYTYWYPVYRNAVQKEHNEECKTYSDGKCSCPRVGDKAPDFRLEGVLNGQRVELSLSDYRGKWMMLLFYPADFTFV